MENFDQLEFHNLKLNFVNNKKVYWNCDASLPNFERDFWETYSHHSESFFLTTDLSNYE